MLVGILSDTHGRAATARAAVKLLIDQGATQLIHCGDVGSEEVLDALAGHRATFVFGNTDFERTALARYAADLGITCGGESAVVELGDGKRGVVTHGDDGRLIRRVLDEQAVDYLFLGHTHCLQDSRQGRVRVINPGALHRAARKTVAVLDPIRDQLRILTVAGSSGDGD